MTVVVDKPFAVTLESLVELLELEDEDDYGVLKPTEYAYLTAMKLVLEAYKVLGSDFPKASASTDDEGGIRLSWQSREKDCRVRVFCPSSPEKKAYIYHQKGDEYGCDYEVSAPALVSWLKWFNEVR